MIMKKFRCNWWRELDHKHINNDDGGVYDDGRAEIENSVFISNMNDSKEKRHS